MKASFLQPYRSLHPHARALHDRWMDAGFSPTTLPNLRVWLRGDLGVTLDGSNNVSAWADQSGNGNNFTQGTAANRPNYNVAPFNGRPTLRFVGASNLTLICVNVLTDPTPNCLILVFSPNSVGAAAQLYSSDLGMFAPIAANGGAEIFSMTATANLTTSTKYCYIGNTNATPATDQYLNGTLQSALAGYTRSARGGTRLGMDVSGVQQWTGDLAEVIYYSRLLSSVEITQIRAYVSARYGFAA